MPLGFFSTQTIVFAIVDLRAWCDSTTTSIDVSGSGTKFQWSPFVGSIYRLHTAILPCKDQFLLDLNLSFYFPLPKQGKHPQVWWNLCVVKHESFPTSFLLAFPTKAQIFLDPKLSPNFSIDSVKSCIKNHCEFFGWIIFGEKQLKQMKYPPSWIITS